MKEFPKNLMAMKSALLEKAPAASLPDDPRFVEDMIRSGKAVPLKSGEALPNDAEFEVITVAGEKRLLRHRVATW